MKLAEHADGVHKDNAQNPAELDRNLLDLLIVLSKRLKFIFGFTATSVVLTAAVVLLIPNKYTATATVIPPAQSSSMSSALLGQISGSNALASLTGSNFGVKNVGDTYVSLFRSRTVEDTVIKRCGLMTRYREKFLSDARRDFETRSSVVLGAKDGLIRISVTDRDPQIAAQIAGAYVDEVRKLSATLAITEASQRRVFFQQQLLDAQKNLATAQLAMKNVQQVTGILQLDSQARSLIESAAVLQGQIAAKKVQIQGMHSYATEDNPQVIMLQEELTALKGELAKLSGRGEGGPDVIVPKGKLPQAGMEYLDTLRNLRYSETVADLIARQFEVAKLDEAREGAFIQIADPASPPDKKSSPHRSFIVGLMMLLAFGVAILWVLVADRWDREMRDPRQRAKVDQLRTQILRRDH